MKKVNVHQIQGIDRKRLKLEPLDDPGRRLQLGMAGQIRLNYRDSELSQLYSNLLSISYFTEST